MPSRNSILQSSLETRARQIVKALGGHWSRKSGMCCCPAHAPALTAIVAAFKTQKPYAGLDRATNFYQLIGSVQHRGIEASFSGEIAPGLSIVAGGVYLRPRLSGAAVTEGIIGSVPVGVPSWRAIGSASYAVRQLTGLSVDLGMEYTGAQAARSGFTGLNLRQTMLPSNIVFDAGARYSFEAVGRPVTARLRILNLTNSYGWQVNGAETLDYTRPRRFAFAVTTEF